jgi:hypothetical protein
LLRIYPYCIFTRMIFRLLPVLSAFILMSACNGSAPKQTDDTTEVENAPIPAAGTVVAADAMTIPDGLNDLKFSVAVAANGFTSRGTYTIRVSYGDREDSTMFTLPKGGARLPVFLKKGDEYSYIIGFTYEGQPYDYYEVSFLPGHPPSTSVRNIKAWSLQ